VILWHKVNQVQLSEQPNDIIWCLTASGNNSVSSAYATQFMGACSDHDWASVWSVKAENKCKILCCLILQNKLWTVDRIINTGGQSNPICQLCRMYPESAMHMIALCPFASSVWQGLAHWIGMQPTPPLAVDFRRLEIWWASWTRKGQNQAIAQKVLHTM
jgi:hypothetical protein